MPICTISTELGANFLLVSQVDLEYAQMPLDQLFLGLVEVACKRDLLHMGRLRVRARDSALACLPS